MEAPALLVLFAQQTPQHAVILLDPNRNIQWLNAKASSLFGYEADDVIGRPMDLLFVPEDVERGIPRYEIDAANARKSSEDDRWMLRADGTRFWAMGCLVELTGGQGEITGYCKILEDRTELKQQLEALRNRATICGRAEKERSRFIGTLGHEVRNTISPLSNALEIVRTKTRGDADLLFPIKIMQRQIDFIKRLVDDMVDVTRVETGKVVLNMREVDLRGVVELAVAAVAESAAQKQQTLKTILLEAPIPVLCDIDRLHQVFVNLLQNATKFTPDGGQITVEATVEGAEAVVKVVDTGCGIDPEALPRIFELFTQGNGAVAKGGLGIGLALVREFVTMHNGIVQARSDGSGKGSQFNVRLPLRE